MITVRDLKKIYAGRVPVSALRGVSFEVARGEFVGIMGRSGSGKSTLLHQLGLLDAPTAGRIIIDGVDVLGLSETQKTLFRLHSLGYVFQEYALISELTALENVHLPARVLNGRKGRRDYEQAKELLDIVGLSDRLHHYPHELSGGEQQRVAIARSLVNRPKIVFADEPTANLDSQSAKVVLELFRKLNKELGQTILMVTHEPDDKQYVNRVIWLQDGLIERIEGSAAGLSVDSRPDGNGIQ